MKGCCLSRLRQVIQSLVLAVKMECRISARVNGSLKFERLTKRTWVWVRYAACIAPLVTV